MVVSARRRFLNLPRKSWQWHLTPLQLGCLALYFQFFMHINAEANLCCDCGRFLSASIRAHILPPTILPPLLLSLRVAIFPGNVRGPHAPEPPSSDERLQIRKRCAEAILSLVPPLLSRAYFSVDSNDEGQEEMIKQVEDILDVFGDSYLNKHLLYNILELVLVRLLPELRESTPSELLSERGVALGEGSDKAL